jgi:hypothetical protein
MHHKASCSARSPRPRVLPRAGCANLADQPRNSRWVPAQPTGTGDPCTQPSHSHEPHATGASPSTLASAGSGRMCARACRLCASDTQPTQASPKHTCVQERNKRYTNMFNTKPPHRPQDKPNAPHRSHPGTKQNADAKLVNFYVCVNLCQFLCQFVLQCVCLCLLRGSQVVFEK